MAWPIIIVSVLSFALLRIYVIFHANRSGKRTFSGRPAVDKCSFAIFLGSGGHTSEALSLISGLDFSRYTPRTYIVSEGDTLSIQKAVALETCKSAVTPSREKIPSRYAILTIPRARRVHQSLLVTPPTAFLSLLSCVYHVTITPLLGAEGIRGPFADVLILNGPGTCVTLCVAVFINKFLGLPSPKLVYVESFARVQSLSLSGKLLRPLVDRFMVQWPTLLRSDGREEYKGWLV